MLCTATNSRAFASHEDIPWKFTGPPLGFLLLRFPVLEFHSQQDFESETSVLGTASRNRRSRWRCCAERG